MRIIRETDPTWFVVENVRGAVRWFRPLLGEPRQSHGPFFLWGQFPGFVCEVKAFKERISVKGIGPDGLSHHRRRAALRAKVPYPMSLALAKAVESNLLSALA